MIKGKSIVELATQLETERNARTDFIANTAGMTVLPPTKEAAFGGLRVGKNGDSRQLVNNKLAVQQIATHTQVPWGYAERMAQQQPDLFAHTLNVWLNTKPEQRLVRAFSFPGKEPIARAFLSNKFRTMDNYDIANAVFPIIQEHGLDVESCDVTETRLYIQIVNKQIKEKVEHKRVQAIAEHRGDSHFAKPGDDMVYPGLVISNSEVGHGLLSFAPMVWRYVCYNGLIINESLFRKRHIGRANTLLGDEDAVQEILSDDTRRMDDAALWLKVRDITNAAVANVEFFQRTVERLSNATDEFVSDDPYAIQQVITGKFGLNEDEGRGFLRHLAAGGSAEFTKYDVLNAVTRTAEDVKSYDRAVELEQLGGTILTTPLKALMPAKRELVPV